MFCTFISDLSVGEPEFYECLYEIIKMNMKIVLFSLLLYFFAKPPQGIVHLHLRFDCWRDQVQWVSVWNNKLEYDKDEDIFILSHDVVL
jgi:hypothetical protein